MNKNEITKDLSELDADAIDREIQKLKEELKNVKGRKTEVYTRIVGYYRSVANWNRGKREEYDHRSTFRLGELKSMPGKKPAHETVHTAPAEESRNMHAETAVSYLYFYRETCPNCPPVHNFLREQEISGDSVNVDTETGMEKAVRYQVMSSPTVIFFDAEGKEVFRGNTIQQLQEKLSPLQIAV